MKGQLLIIEGKKAEKPLFAENLKAKGFFVSVVTSGADALILLNENYYDLIIINSSSFGSSGSRISSTIREKFKQFIPIILIVDDASKTVNAKADLLVQLPLSVQKLINRISIYLPGDDSTILQAGPIYLDIQKKYVRCLNKNSKITPKLVAILRVLIERRGEVVEREELFKRVWETDYIGDTRTLDVHISWLREAIEKDPLSPKFIITARGVGFRLDA